MLEIVIITVLNVAPYLIRMFWHAEERAHGEA